MTTISVIADILGIIFLCLGIILFIFEVIGIYKYRFVLNRMHSAGMGDSLGIFLALLGLMLISGLNYTTLKFALVIFFMWLTSPTASHLISGLEALTNDNIEDNADIRVEDLKSYVDGHIEGEDI